VNASRMNFSSSAIVVTLIAIASTCTPIGETFLSALS
jgi:hypothetical protein